MNTHARNRSAGFTVIEIIVVIVIFAVASILFFYQKSNLQTANLDERRKTAINSIYYNLEEVFYAKNSYYPAEITSSNLTAMDPALLTDTNGVKIDDKVDTSTLDDVSKALLGNEDTRLSEYVYEPINCEADGKCKGYTLRVMLANEAEYIKKSRHN
ncbi:prepilin-type N-terminal cleavage/methylation domain-containing protein [Candidatus Saccharibacteria bacterium]|nr:prepilin-type N-terminal cleavage/methylation domain-containing protein [Candidatus Saccharibacteria bacterium]